MKKVNLLLLALTISIELPANIFMPVDAGGGHRIRLNRIQIYFMNLYSGYIRKTIPVFLNHPYYVVINKLF